MERDGGEDGTRRPPDSDDAGDGSPAAGVPPVEVLLRDLDRANEELRLWLKSQRQLLTSGVAASGFLLGYAFISSGERYLLITLVPVVVAAVTFLVVDAAMNALYLSAHAYDLEREIERRYGGDLPAFGWEHKYGGLVANDRFEAGSELLWGVSVPAVLTAVVAAAVYVALVAASLWAIRTSDVLPDSRLLVYAALVAYVVVGVMALAAAAKHRRTKYELRTDRAPDDA